MWNVARCWLVLVEVRREAIRMPELPWLLMLGWYLTVMLRDDQAAVIV
jgi:hypothetical protein